MKVLVEIDLEQYSSAHELIKVRLVEPTDDSYVNYADCLATRLRKVARVLDAVRKAVKHEFGG